jgi:hypothetical protein
VFSLKLPADPRRTPPRVRDPHRHDPRLNLRGDLMRARQRPRRPIGQIRQATISGIPTQPLMHRLPRHPEPARHHRHRRTVKHLPHRLIPLLHHGQLHQHRRLPSPRPTSITTNKAAPARMKKHQKVSDS